MKKNKKHTEDRPSLEQLQSELKRENYRIKYSEVLRSTVFTLVIVASMAVLAATLWLPVLQIYGGSMNPTLTDGDIVVSVKGGEYERGDIVAFYYNNKILIKRVIALPGERVNMDSLGYVYINDEKLDEPYVSDLSVGECDIIMPYEVPDARLFVMGDHRNVSIDSRTEAVGCVSEEQVVGKLVMRIWPLSKIGYVD